MSLHYSPALLMLQTALCYAAARQSDRALVIFQRELRPAAFSLRECGYFRAPMADVLADLGEPDEAAVVGAQALSIARITGSLRTWTEVSRTVHALTPWLARPSVRTRTRGTAPVYALASRRYGGEGAFDHSPCAISRTTAAVGAKSAAPWPEPSMGE